MVRLGGIIVLFISVVMMVKMIAETWEDKTVPINGTVKQQKKISEDLPDDIRFNPPVPPTMPDFKTGYLFNEDRQIEEEKEAPQEPEEENLDSDDIGIATDINEVTYSGAIITETFKRAIITYSPAPQQQAKSERPTSGRIKKIASRGRASLENTQLSEGDLISGYKVASILENKIVFRKGEETVEKYIYDPDKKRAQPVRSSAPKLATGAPPRPQQQTTAGSPATPPSSSVLGKDASTDNNLHTETPQTRTPAPVARRPTATRRLIISRTPPPKPDTSRVSRRRRASSPADSMEQNLPGMPGAPPGQN